jgi:xylulose-5-phosphate/fructose-6-phosphate phosphoketolase
VVVNKSPAVTRIYLPPDANCLLAVADHCLRSTDCINVIVCDKQKHLQYLDMEAASPLRQGHRHLGLGQQRRGRGTGRGDGRLRRHGDQGGAGGGAALLREHFPRSEDALRQRGGPVQAARPRANTRTA